jgi:hypothetical protein
VHFDVKEWATGCFDVPAAMKHVFVLKDFHVRTDALAITKQKLPLILLPWGKHILI